MAEFNILVKKEDGSLETINIKNAESLAIQKNILIREGCDKNRQPISIKPIMTNQIEVE